MARARTLLWLVTLAVAIFPAYGLAADVLIPGKIHIIKEGKLTKMVARPTTTFPVPASGGASDPRMGGGSLTIVDTGDAGATFGTALPAGQWRGLGNPAGAKGYKFSGAGSATDPCKSVLVKSSVIKFVCKSDQSLDPPLTGESAIALALGTDNYCAQFGGTDIKNIAGLTKRKEAPAPGACPTVAACCAGLSHLSLSAAAGSGACGTVFHNNGPIFRDVSCGELYFGSGITAAGYLPVSLPTGPQSIAEIASCTGQTGTLAAATAAETGSSRTCTDAGCFFGAPLAVPNPTTPATSVCGVVTITTPLTGSVHCGTGVIDVTTTLETEIFASGDLLPGEPGIQPCPLCTGGDPMTPGSGTCQGGPNNTLACTPATADLGDPYPTSQDCPPPPADSVATVSSLTAAVTTDIAWTAVPSGTQLRTFCGYCRDADTTLAFENPANACLVNGMTVGGGCAQPFESCEQRTNGAFGPSGTTANTISIGGAPAGNLKDSTPHSGTLVSVFCVSPTFNAVVESALDLPGPGLFALPVSAELCAAASPCP